MPTESVYPMLFAEDETETAHVQLYLRKALPRGRFHALLADAVSHVIGSVAYGITSAICSLFELGDPGPRDSAEVVHPLPPRAEAPVRPAENPLGQGVWPANPAGLGVAPYPAAARQVTPLVQPGAYRGL